MKISIGTKIQDGPWGGGNLFAVNFKNYLIEKGIEVVFDLKDKDIDIILLTEPRKTSPSSAFTNYDVLDYVTYINPDAIVVHRVNECDEHKDTNFINKYIAYANKCADATVFVSSWIKDLYLQFEEIKSKPYKVILAGADEKIFNPNNHIKWSKKNKFKLVTHHWSNNWNKGFSIYKEIDNLLNKKEISDKFEFTFIGRLPENLIFQNINVIEPKVGEELATALKQNDFYITGTINEPSGNHHIEAAQCGLPVMYIDSGGVKEYCEDYGVEYNLANLENKIFEVYENYEKYYEKIKTYNNNATKMCDEFLAFFNELILKKSILLKNRENNKKSWLKKVFYKFKI